MVTKAELKADRNTYETLERTYQLEQIKAAQAVVVATLIVALMVLAFAIFGFRDDRAKFTRDSMPVHVEFQKVDGGGSQSSIQ